MPSTKLQLIVVINWRLMSYDALDELIIRSQRTYYFWMLVLNFSKGKPRISKVSIKKKGIKLVGYCLDVLVRKSGCQLFSFCAVILVQNNFFDISPISVCAMSVQFLLQHRMVQFLRHLLINLDSSACCASKFNLGWEPHSSA